MCGGCPPEVRYKCQAQPEEKRNESMIVCIRFGPIVIIDDDYFCKDVPILGDRSFQCVSCDKRNTEECPGESKGKGYCQEYIRGYDS